MSTAVVQARPRRGRRGTCSEPVRRHATGGTVRTPPVLRRAAGASPPSPVSLSSGDEISPVEQHERFTLDTGGWVTLAFLLVGFYDILAKAVNDAFGEHILPPSREIAHRLDPRRLFESPALEWLALFVVAAARARAQSPAIRGGGDGGPSRAAEDVR